MNSISLYPLLFEPIFQYRIWGSRRLADVLSMPLPDDRPIGEAWVLSDRDDHASVVADGPLTGKTFLELLEAGKEPMLGKLASRYDRFPLLLKFLDAARPLSVQVHPSDDQKEYLPPGEHGKTEAWLVLDTGPDSIIYAGLNPGTTPEDVWRSSEDGTVSNLLAQFKPNPGEGVFLRAGTVHTMGDLVAFEVQENSDVTFRLYDWGQVDPYTNLPRPLQVKEAMACIDFSKGPVSPVTPIVESETPVLKERLFDCEFFRVWRLSGEASFIAGVEGYPRVLVCIAGEGQVDHDGASFPIKTGNVMFLPAVIGPCFVRPEAAITVLEIALPED
jgi:mannose-6-phosphate isomerase